MKSHKVLAAMLLASAPWLIQPAMAVDAHHPDQKAAAPQPSADQTIQKMEDNTKRMQVQLEKMAKTKDPKERQLLLQQHMKTMQENAAMAQGMMSAGCPMMGPGMMGGGMGMMGGGAGAPDVMMNRMQMMEKRMDMMQMMLEQMSKGQQAPVPAAQ